MSAVLLHEAAALMREDAQLEAILREDDPHFANEASTYELRWHPAVALAIAHSLDTEAVHADEADYLAAHAMNVALTNVTPAYRPSTHEAFAVARAYLGRPS